MLKEIINSVPKSVLKEIQKQLNNVEAMINSHYPEC